MARVATSNQHKEVYDDIIAVLQRYEYDDRDVAEVFEMLILSALFTFFDQAMADSLYAQMLALGVVVTDKILALKAEIDDFDPEVARAQAKEEAELAAQIQEQEQS